MFMNLLQFILVDLCENTLPMITLRVLLILCISLLALCDVPTDEVLGINEVSVLLDWHTTEGFVLTASGASCFHWKSSYPSVLKVVPIGEGSASGCTRAAQVLPV